MIPKSIKNIIKNTTIYSNYVNIGELDTRIGEAYRGKMIIIEHSNGIKNESSVLKKQMLKIIQLWLSYITISV